MLIPSKVTRVWSCTSKRHKNAQIAGIDSAATLRAFLHGIQAKVGRRHVKFGTYHHLSPADLYHRQTQERATNKRLLADCAHRLLQTVFSLRVERCINDKLMGWSERLGILRRAFNGFIGGPSLVVRTLLGVALPWSVIAKDRYELLGVLSLDLKGAYDKVDLEVPLNSLRNLAIPKCITNFVCNLINDRKIIGFFNDSPFKESTMNKGLPKRYILSPFLFNLYICRILNHIPNTVMLLVFEDAIRVLYLTL